MERYILFSTIENSNWNRYKYDRFPSHGRNLSSFFRYFDLRGDVSSNRSWTMSNIFRVMTKRLFLYILVYHRSVVRLFRP